MEEMLTKAKNIIDSLKEKINDLEVRLYSKDDPLNLLLERDLWRFENVVENALAINAIYEIAWIYPLSTNEERKKICDNIKMLFEEVKYPKEMFEDCFYDNLFIEALIPSISEWGCQLDNAINEDIIGESYSTEYLYYLKLCVFAICFGDEADENDIRYLFLSRMFEFYENYLILKGFCNSDCGYLNTPDSKAILKKLLSGDASIREYDPLEPGYLDEEAQDKCYKAYECMKQLIKNAEIFTFDKALLESLRDNFDDNKYPIDYLRAEISHLTHRLIVKNLEIEKQKLLKQLEKYENV